MTRSRIEWTEMTWNPTTGCTKISAGCKHCYAETMARRLKAMGVRKYARGFCLALHEADLATPLTWTKPRRVFVNSMSDLFHRDVPVSFIHRVFDTMTRCPQHVFQVLTKRAGRLRQLDAVLPWPGNVWMGVSVEDGRQEPRIDALRETSAAVKFLSIEPLLGPLPALNLEGIDWVIVGGESGARARQMNPSWVADIRDQCSRAKVPFFFKQWGGVHKKRNGRLLDGRTYDEMPLPAGTNAA
jgi:protein gp37